MFYYGDISFCLPFALLFVYLTFAVSLFPSLLGVIFSSGSLEDMVTKYQKRKNKMWEWKNASFVSVVVCWLKFFFTPILTTGENNALFLFFHALVFSSSSPVKRRHFKQNERHSLCYTSQIKAAFKRWPHVWFHFILFYAKYLQVYTVCLTGDFRLVWWNLHINRWYTIIENVSHSPLNQSLCFGKNVLEEK